MTEKKRPLWQPPWQFKESALIVAGIVAVGFALQLYLGHFNFFLLHYPVNAGVAAGLLIFLALTAPLRNSAIYRWISGVPFAVSCIAALLMLGIIMGLTPQVIRVDPHAHTLISDLGFTSMTSAWPFVMLYAVTLLSLGMLLVRRVAAFRAKDIPFLLNHAGLWILLLAAGLGAADMQRFVMHVREGEVEWRVYSQTGDVLELPIAISLKDFSMEEYPPRLVIINRENGLPQPEGNPDYLQTGETGETSIRGTLGDWTVTIDEYIHEAVRTEDGFRHSPMPASTPAVRVSAVNTKSGEAHSGWICGGGNIPGFFSGLALDDTMTMVMTVPEPKRFASDITVVTADGLRESARLEVNKPLSIGDWMIYQYGYDTNAGKMSAYSSMELVHDAWLLPAYAGMLLMIAGSCVLIWSGTGKRRKSHDLE